MAELRVLTSLRPKHIKNYPTSGGWASGPEAIYLQIRVGDKPVTRMIRVPEPVGGWPPRG